MTSKVMLNPNAFEFVQVSPLAFSLAVRHDQNESIKRVKASGSYHGPHKAASLKIKAKFVEAVTIQPGDHISICRYRVFVRFDGDIYRKHIAWCGTQTYPYSGRYARMLINAYHPGTGSRRPYLTLDGNF